MAYIICGTVIHAKVIPTTIPVATEMKFGRCIKATMRKYTIGLSDLEVADVTISMRDVTH